MDSSTSVKAVCIECDSERLADATFKRLHDSQQPKPLRICLDCGTTWTVKTESTPGFRFRSSQLREVNQKIRTALYDFEHTVEECLGEELTRAGSVLTRALAAVHGLLEAEAVRQDNLRLMRLAYGEDDAEPKAGVK